jgi:hypothetical protein
LEGDATASPFFDGDAHRRSGRLVPGKLIDSVGEPHDVGFLALDPAPTDHTVVDSVVDGLCVLHIHLVTPAVVVRVDEVLADESRQLKLLLSTVLNCPASAVLSRCALSDHFC